jgi:predicted nuclease with RNAse H fold/uncharacterized protein YprB with RNaseH-like and TPR domain/dephospho-CoA kinase
MDEQSMLPFHDMPIARSDRVNTVDRSSRKKSQPFKPVAPGVAAALADPARVVFLDVETTGLSWYYDDITVVGWMCGGRYDFHIAGEHPMRLAGALHRATALVTFNGTLFDLRFLRKAFGTLTVPPVHIDLRYFARRVGLSGGQKAIEKLLGLPQRTNLESFDGGEAVLAWHRYLRGDESSLRKLIEYNRYDVLGMCGILDTVLARLNTHPDLWISLPKFAERVEKTASWANTIPRSPQSHELDHRYNTFARTFSGTPAKRATVVGIDLTGSEARPSGWSVLSGSEAVTDMVASDDEIVSRTVAAKPDIVSVDSPLSVPFGRTRVEDDDPGREQFGIMRRCERELKRRGINVYPCLLPSMQRLTRRGISLAARFRSMGIPVIESYPGAAQDIMGIPRKGVGVEFLKQSLVDFGIRGSFANDKVTHDELDAITSAIVGLFFVSGRFEALSGPLEDALIIPNLTSSGYSGMVIGISGKICAGKTTTARILEQNGFAYTRFSQVIDDEIVARGEAPDRATRQRAGMEIHHAKGQRWLCERVLERVSNQKLIVIDGLRFPEDHAFFVERFGSAFFHIHITAPDGLRAARYRESERDGLSFEIADRQPVEEKVEELAKFAATVLPNDASTDELANNVMKSVREFAHKQGDECLSQL